MPYSGRFLPKNPKKYNGDPSNIIYRSSWEVRVMKYLDDHPNVLWWSSEELAIPYKSPIDNKVHRYFPDFIAKIKRKDGTVMTYVLEVKPEKQTKMPVKRKKTQTYINETVTYAINQEKWRAAELFCFEHGWQFKLITERELGLV
jgi:hypothetical protein